MRLPDAPITPTVIFDLDGTLVHTVPDIAAALDVALAPYQAGPTSIGDAAAMMGDGLSEFFWKALIAKRINLPATEADATRKRFIEAYAQSPTRLSHVYPGIRTLLKELRERGVHTAVCTNKIERIAVDILERLELRDFFDAVVGSGDDRPMKPDPRPILEAVARAGGRIERAHSGRRHGRRLWRRHRRAHSLGSRRLRLQPFAHQRAQVRRYRRQSAEPA